MFNGKKKAHQQSANTSNIEKSSSVTAIPFLPKRTHQGPSGQDQCGGKLSSTLHSLGRGPRLELGPQQKHTLFAWLVENKGTQINIIEKGVSQKSLAIWKKQQG